MLAIEATADGITAATAVKPRMISGRTRMASIAIFTSLASIFLPRYSGVRPTISPAMKTARIDEEQHAVKARADAAEDDLAELMLISGTMPPSGVKVSCMVLTAPQEASVVITANRAPTLAMPKRTSLPSILPPA